MKLGNRMLQEVIFGKGDVNNTILQCQVILVPDDYRKKETKKAELSDPAFYLL